MAKQIRVAAKMSPENGKKMLELEERVNGELQAYLLHHADKSEAEMISRANMALYNMAQCRGVSLWKLCFEVMPHWEASAPKTDTMQQDRNVTMNIDYDLHLVPIVIDWEHGEGYWEKKYRDLQHALKLLCIYKEITP